MSMILKLWLCSYLAITVACGSQDRCAVEQALLELSDNAALDCGVWRAWDHDDVALRAAADCATQALSSGTAFRAAVSPMVHDGEIVRGYASDGSTSYVVDYTHIFGQLLGSDCVSLTAYACEELSSGTPSPSDLGMACTEAGNTVTIDCATGQPDLE